MDDLDSLRMELAALEQQRVRDNAYLIEERDKAIKERDEAQTKVLVYETDANAVYMSGKAFMRGHLEPVIAAADAAGRTLVRGLEMIRIAAESPDADWTTVAVVAANTLTDALPHWRERGEET